MRSSSSHRCSRTKAYDDGSARSSASTRNEVNSSRACSTSPRQTRRWPAMRSGRWDTMTRSRGSAA